MRLNSELQFGWPFLGDTPFNRIWYVQIRAQICTVFVSGGILDIAVSFFCDYWLSLTNTVSEQKIPITILILKRGPCLWYIGAPDKDEVGYPLKQPKCSSDVLTLK